MCTFRKLERIGMNHYSDQAALFDSDDENLLLDDDNTALNTNTLCPECFKARRTVCRHNKMNGCNVEDLLDSADDSPLLTDDRLNSFGHLSIKDFHCHSHDINHDSNKAYKTLCIVSVLCFVFMITEIIGGYLAGSLAVMTDAAHLFSDLIGFLVSIISIWIGRRPPTSSMTFGYHRAEVMGAFLSVLAVWLLAGLFCILAIDRIIKKEHDIDADTMLIVAGLGLVVNILMGAVLHGFCSSSSSSHSHGGLTSGEHSHSDNINIRAAAAHVIGDLLQSVGVLLAAIIIKIYPGAEIADPICTILFSVIVVLATVRVAKDSVLLLIEASPSSTSEISAALKNISGVQHVHSLHIWSLSPGKEALATHLAVDESCDRDTVLNQATFIVKNRLKVVSCTIQIEAYDHEKVSICTECQQLQC